MSVNIQQYSKLKHRPFKDMVLKRQFPRFKFPQVVQTLWIRNNHLIVQSLSNISARNYQNRLMRVEVIKCNISVVF